MNHAKSVILSNFSKSEREGLQKVQKLSVSKSIILKLKIEAKSGFLSENKWNSGVKSNIENFDFWLVPTSRFTLILTKRHRSLESKAIYFFHHDLGKLNFSVFLSPSLNQFSKLDKITQFTRFII